MTPAPSPRHPFAAFAGGLAESLNFNKSVGQIYGLLYLSPGPLSLGDIARDLGMSKGNASINLRTLESWGAVRRVPVGSSRQDHYQADDDLRGLALRRLREGLGRRLTVAEENLDAALASLEKGGGGLDAVARKRLLKLRKTMASARKALDVLPGLLKFLPG